MAKKKKTDKKLTEKKKRAIETRVVRYPVTYHIIDGRKLISSY